MGRTLPAVYARGPLEVSVPIDSESLTVAPPRAVLGMGDKSRPALGGRIDVGAVGAAFDKPRATIVGRVGPSRSPPSANGGPAAGSVLLKGIATSGSMRQEAAVRLSSALGAKRKIT